MTNTQSTPQTTPHDLLSLYSASEKKITMTLSFTDGQMFFFYHLDRDFEGGRWRDWPRIPEFARWVTLRTWGKWRASWWRFAACGVDGNMKPLGVLKGEDESEGQ